MILNNIRPCVFCASVKKKFDYCFIYNPYVTIDHTSSCALVAQIMMPTKYLYGSSSKVATAVVFLICRFVLGAGIKVTDLRWLCAIPKIKAIHQGRVTSPCIPTLCLTFLQRCTSLHPEESNPERSDRGTNSSGRLRTSCRTRLDRNSRMRLVLSACR